MIIIEKPLEMQEICARIKFKNKSIGLIPTMGALHDGHISLVHASKKENDLTIVSIFINPIQFGPAEDFKKYPRTFENDCKLLEKEKTDYLFFPSNELMYGKTYETYVELSKLPNHLCGLRREGHFRGVTTVVTKFFNIVKPSRAYFGKKDYQQALILKKMAEDLNMDVEIRMMPIFREPDGLAMSSRNSYLKDNKRKDALILYRSLELVKKIFSDGERKSETVIREMEKFILQNVPYAKIDYISIADPETLEDLEIIKEKAVIAVAVFISNVRLIDNIEISVTP